MRGIFFGHAYIVMVYQVCH